MFPEQLPWYKSKIIIGALVSIIMKVLVATGVLGTALDDKAVTDAALLIIGGVADMYVIYHRTTQKAAPTITTQ